MICPVCNTPQDSNARYCVSCGATLNFENDLTEATASFVAPAQSISDPLIGLSIDGRYRLDSLIGKGGMGSVYRATRLLIGDEVAIKILHTDQKADPHAAERFQREARAAARLKHPNAVSIYDFGVANSGLQYLVMDLLDGRSLRDIIKEKGPLELPLVIEITSQVCAALDEAHRQHIIHRDIKPDNIILNPALSGLRVKVLDFGIAKLRDDSASHLTQTGSVMGTPHYMSPEQCLGEELDSGADIYSMGIVVYEMLCGRVPFNSPISTAVVVQHVNQPPPSLRSFNASIPSPVEAVVLHALEKRREARPSSAGELSKALASALQGVPAAIQVSSAAIGLQLDGSRNQAQSVQEETVERKIGIEPDPGQYLPKTVHLATPGNATPVIVRDTKGHSPLETVRLPSSAVRYFKLALPIVGAGAVVGLLIWFLSPFKSMNRVVNQPSSTQLTNPTVHSTDSTTKLTEKKLSPPAGMVLVDGEQFMMGSNKGDSDSAPVHMVAVKSFFLDTYEVTCEEYKRFIDERRQVPPTNWVNGNYAPGIGKRPVTGVSWQDAAAFAEWAGKRLPTEQEWEFAARGRGLLIYPWGNTWRAGCANADEEGEARKGLADVGTHDCSSPFGAQDLIGNAWEWTSSDWIPYPGGKLANPTFGGEKVIRGGSWESPRTYATTVFRSGYKGPGEQTGFRCAKDAQ